MRLPSGWQLDGDLKEWPLASGPPSVLQFSFTPHFWVIALDLDNGDRLPLEVEVILPDRGVPDIGEIVTGGGTYPVNCEHRPWDETHKRSPADRRACQRKLAHRERLLRTEPARYRKRIVVARSLDAIPVPGGAQVCQRASPRITCELLLPLSALPRTTQNPLFQFGARVLAEKHSPPEPVSLQVPPVFFEPGVALRALVMGEDGEDSVLPEAGRISYQPGTSGYEELYRVGDWQETSANWSTANVASPRQGHVSEVLHCTTMLAAPPS